MHHFTIINGAQGLETSLPAISAGRSPVRHDLDQAVWLHAPERTHHGRSGDAA